MNKEPMKSVPEQALEGLAQQHIDHLAEQDIVVAPWLYAGHVDWDSPEASPEVQGVTILPTWPQHPLNNKPLIVARFADDDRELWAAYDRIACTTDGCARCARLWDQYRSAVEDLPHDATISALAAFETESLPLIVDAWDIPSEWEEEMNA